MRTIKITSISSIIAGVFFMTFNIGVIRYPMRPLSHRIGFALGASLIALGFLLKPKE